MDVRTGLATLLLGLVLSGCASATDPLPPGFEGAWDLTPAACADPDGVTRLGIAPAKLQYYESGGEVLSVLMDGDGSVRVDLDWLDTSDTDDQERPIPRRLAAKLILSPDQSRLRVTLAGTTTSYVRCSGGRTGTDAWAGDPEDVDPGDDLRR